MNRHVEIALNYLIGDSSITESQAVESARIALRYAEIVRERGFVLRYPALGWEIRADYVPGRDHRSAHFNLLVVAPAGYRFAPGDCAADPDDLLAAWQSFIDHLLTLPEASEPGVAAMLVDAREALYR